MSNEISLKIDNKKFTNWENVSIARSLTSLSGSFSLVTTDKSLIDSFDDSNVVEIFCDDKLAVTGFVDKLALSISNTAFSISISGRGVLSDLVDCSAVNKPGTWNNIKLEQLIRELIKPFSFKLVSSLDTGDKFKKFTINSGETVFEALSRACSLRRAILIMDTNGDLVLKELGKTTSNSVLELGKNLKTFDFTKDVSNRFSDYSIRGSGKVSGDAWSKKTIGITYKLEDSEIKRYRPLQINASDNVTAKNAKDQLEWEAQIRAAKALNITTSVIGWKQQNGDLWDINLLVKIRAKMFNIETVLLISSITFTYSDNEYSTKIGLSDPRIFSNKPVPPVKFKKKGW